MPLTGNEDHSISLADAAEMTKNYRKSAGPGAFLGGYFGQKGISKVLEHEDCVGIRIYNAEDENGKKNFVIVGVNADNDDLTDEEILEHGMGCPPFCPDSSPLTDD